MKSRVEITGYLLVLFFLFVLFLTGYITPASPAPRATLNVPLIAQQGSYWCWAAVTEMVTTYLNRDSNIYPIITQCQLVQQYFDSLTPPDTTLYCPLTSLPVDAQHDVMGSPFGNSWLYSYTPWTGLTAPPIAMLDSLFSLENPQPIIFTWQIQGAVPQTYDSGASAHYLVGEGMASSQYNFNKAWVTVNDPEPVLGGHHEIITYTEFAGIAPMQEQQGHFNDSTHFIRSYNKQHFDYGWGGAFYNFRLYGGASK